MLEERIRLASGKSPSASDLFRRSGQRAAGITGVDGGSALDQQERRLLISARAVLDPARHDEQLARTEFYVAIAQLNRQVAVEDEEEVIGVVVLVPYKLALDLDDA